MTEANRNSQTDVLEERVCYKTPNPVYELSVTGGMLLK